jgi:hypothetical protein
MRSTARLTCLAWFLVLAPACESTTPSEKANAEIAAGRSAWAQRKPLCTAYSYDRLQISDSIEVTGVQIVGDVPAWRSYTRMIDQFSLADAWVETGAEVGSNAAGYPARTMEQLYDDCASYLPLGLTQGAFHVTVADGALLDCAADSCRAAFCGTEIHLQGFTCGQLDPPHLVGVSAGTPDAGTVDGAR